MIFVTVGTQLPFDRLVAAVAAWHRERPDCEVFGQIGDTAAPPAFAWTRFLDGPGFAEKLDAARIVVSHAGIGTVLACWSRAKPLVVMPRSAALGEHRSDHQIATVEHLGRDLSLAVAHDAQTLAALLNGPTDALVPRRAGESADGARISDHINAWLEAGRR